MLECHLKIRLVCLLKHDLKTCICLTTHATRGFSAKMLLEIHPVLVHPACTKIAKTEFILLGIQEEKKVRPNLQQFLKYNLELGWGWGESDL